VLVTWLRMVVGSKDKAKPICCLGMPDASGLRVDLSSGDLYFFCSPLNQLSSQGAGSAERMVVLKSASYCAATIGPGNQG